MTDYKASKRIIGTSAERTALNLASPPQTSWKEIARTTLGSAGDTITVDSIPDRDNLMVLFHGIPSGQLACNFTLNNDTGSNYAGRKSSNGGSDGAETGKSNLWLNGQSRDNTVFSVFDIVNMPSQEKLINGMLLDANTAGAGNAPDRREIIGKWANTSNAISRFDGNNTGTGDFASDSEIVILGCNNDEADSGTNFWQELASVELSSNGNLSTGTFTAKKYLMVQTYFKPTGANTSGMVMNNDTGYNYANRRSKNGGAEETRTSADSLAGIQLNGNYNEGDWAFTTSFIINKSDKEKLSINEFNAQNTSGAGNAPDRVESVGKWTNTSSQITEIDITDGAGGALTLTSGSRIKVWGAD